jgi:hypothetical protein
MALRNLVAKMWNPVAAVLRLSMDSKVLQLCSAPFLLLDGHCGRQARRWYTLNDAATGPGSQVAPSGTGPTRSSGDRAGLACHNLRPTPEHRQYLDGQDLSLLLKQHRVAVLVIG